MVWYHDPLVWTIILLFIAFIGSCIFWPVNNFLDTLDERDEDENDERDDR